MKIVDKRMTPMNTDPSNLETGAVFLTMNGYYVATDEYDADGDRRYLCLGGGVNAYRKRGVIEYYPGDVLAVLETELHVTGISSEAKQ